RDPAGPGIASPIGHAFLNGGRAEHPGVSGGDETGPFGVGGDVSLEGHRAQLARPPLGPCDRNVHGRPSWILRTSPVVERPSRYGRMTTLPPAASTSSRPTTFSGRSEEHTSELQSRENLVCRLLLEKKKLKNPVGLNQREGKRAHRAYLPSNDLLEDGSYWMVISVS